VIKNLHTHKCINGVLIDRTTKWGNPFIMNCEADRESVCEQYRVWLNENIKNGSITLEELAELAGKDLYCWCAPKRCHGNILAKAAFWAKMKLENRNV
jgi:hypothetical protein